MRGDAEAEDGGLWEEIGSPGFSCYAGPLDGLWLCTHHNRLSYVSEADCYPEIVHLYELAANPAGPCFSHCGSFIHQQ